MAEQLQVLLYVSESARAVAADAAQEIARESRTNNGRDGITGLLAFDGAAFTQYLEGPPAAIEGLLARLREDDRHRDMEVLHLGEHRDRRFPGWRLGYLRLDLQEFGIPSLRGKRGAAAMEAFSFILPALDVHMEEPSGNSQPA